MASEEVNDTAVESTAAVEGSKSPEESYGKSLIVYIDLWVFISLVLAAFVLHLLVYLRPYIKLPKSGMMLIAGIFLRCVGEHIGMLTDTVRLMDNIEAETILLIFLPALISECAFQTDWYTFWKEKYQILMLATTAVALSSFLTAVVIRYVLRYEDDFGWYSAFMLGAILSATDHVAVVAQLKEVNADRRLETLIQGETLLNDGTVIVLFSAMMKGATGLDATGSDVVREFFRLSLGGVVLGLAFGWCLFWWVGRVINQPIIETLLTVIASYLLFFTADATDVHFSGALATVTLGLYMSAKGKVMVSPEVEKTVDAFWEILGASFEALILILGGMLMGHFFINFESLHHADIGMLFALFALLHVVRAATILVHWPFLRLMGYGCPFKHMLVLIFGALKGTISIALSLMVFHNTGLDERTRDLVLFWSVGVSALSAFFDAFVLHFVVRVLGLESMTNIEENMLISVTTSIHEVSHSFVDKLKKSDEFSMANWGGITTDAGPDNLLSDVLEASKNGRKVRSENPAISKKELVRKFTNKVCIQPEAIRVETRRRFFTTLKGIYWHLFEHKQCFGHSTLTLIHAANQGLDDKHQPMHDWKVLETQIFPRRIIRLLQWATSKPSLSWLFRKLLYSYITDAYDVGRSFITAHIDAEKLLDEMEIDINAELFEEVMKESREQIELAREFLMDNIQDVYPEVYIFVQTKHATAKIIDREERSIVDAYQEGVITEIEYLELMKSINKKIHRLNRLTTPKKPTVLELLMSCSLFKDLASVPLHSLVDHLKDEHISKGGPLFSKHPVGSGIYVVLRGRIREGGDSFSINHAAGDVVGLQYLLPDYNGPSSSSEAVTSAKVVFISRSEIDDLLCDPKFESDFWFIGARRLFVICKEAFGELGQLDPARLNTVFSNSKLNKFTAEMDVPLSTGTVFLRGAVSSGHAALRYVRGVDRTKSTATVDTIALQFNEDFGKFVRNSETDLKSTICEFELKDGAPQTLKLTKKTVVMETFSRMLTKQLSNMGRRKAPMDNREYHPAILHIPPSPTFRSKVFSTEEDELKPFDEKNQQ